jgi:hypothetical protein
VSKGETVEHAGLFELAQARRKHVGSQSELALQIAVALRPVEELFDDEESPSCANYFEGRGEVTHPFESASGFIQNGE